MNYFDSNLIICAILDDSNLGDWARGMLEKVQDGEMPTCTSFLTFDEVFYEIFRCQRCFYIWKALENIREYKVLLPRDAIHAATALIAGERLCFQRTGILTE